LRGGLLGLGLAGAACVLAGLGQASTPHRVEMKNVAFMPRTLTIHAGDSVVWRNEDIVAHTATSAQAGLDVVLAPGAEQTTAFPRPGVVKYLCRYHPNMTGQITVER